MRMCSFLLTELLHGGRVRKRRRMALMGMAHTD